MKRTDKILLGSLLFLFCFDLLFVFLVIGQGMVQLHAENGLLENLQVLMLVLNMVVFLLQPFFSNNYHRIFSLGGAFLCLVFLLRELDVEELDLPAIVIFIGSGMGRNILMAFLGVLLFAYFLRKIEDIKGFLPGFFLEKSSLTILIGLILLVLGGLFDKENVAVTHYQLYEELIELTGYILMFTGTVMGCFDRQVTREITS